MDTKYLLDIDLFILDIITGKALKLASYDNISYLGIRQSKQGDVFFISRSEYRQINQDSPGDLQRFHEYDSVNVSTLEIFPTIRETISSNGFQVIVIGLIHPKIFSVQTIQTILVMSGELHHFIGGKIILLR